MARKEKDIGNFMLGNFPVEVFTDDSTWDGEGQPRTVEGHVGIKIGLRGDWPDILDLVFHEAQEMLCTMLGMRWHYDNADMVSDGAMFLFDHARFCTMTRDIGRFASQVIPPIEREWCRLHKQKHAWKIPEKVV